MADTTTSPKRDVAVLVGSLRRQSFNRKLALALAELVPPSLALEIVEIGDLPLFNQDVEDDASPAPWIAFRKRIQRADAVLFFTPEYNRSMSAALKNAIDVGSRPRGENAWRGKPGAVVSVSAGALGAFGAHHHVRQCLVALNVPTMAAPEMYVGKASDLLDETGRVTNDSTRELLTKFGRAFADWIESNLPRKAP